MGNLNRVNLFPSVFVESMFKLPYRGDLLPFNFDGRRYLREIYDVDAHRLLLCCGRQTEKSTLLGNRLLTLPLLTPFLKCLYVSPTQMQSETFSKDRIAAPFEMSAALEELAYGSSNDKGAKARTGRNVLYKKFISGSEINIRYAYHSADRIRGQRSDWIGVDEIQDVVTDHLPIIEETANHSEWKYFVYSGTPKTVDNTLAFYWENFSSKNEWMVPCEGCNHWNILGERNIGKTGLICSRCGKGITAQNPRARWVSDKSRAWLDRADPSTMYVGYRISQLMVPWLDWSATLDKYERYERYLFYNEVLGRPYDSGKKALPRELLQEHATGPSMAVGHTFAGQGSPLYMGIDWGTGESHSYTVVTIGGYLGGKFRYIYAKRFTGEEAANQELQISLISKLVNKYRISIIGADYGGGYFQNDKLVRMYSLRRVMKYQYNNAKMLHWDHGFQRYMVNRTAVLMAFINAWWQRTVFELPPWSEWEFPFGEDMESVTKEMSTERKGAPSRLILSKNPSRSDDTLHSMLYCFLASMLQHPRPDILTPTGIPGQP